MLRLKSDVRKDIEDSMQDDELWTILDSAEGRNSGFGFLVDIAQARWTKKLNKRFFKEVKIKTHLLISGGNYTCDVILPYFLKRAKDSLPWYPIKIGLAEHGAYEDLKGIEADVIFSAFYPSDREDFSSFKKQINRQGFETTRLCFAEDRSSMGCSSEMFHKGDEQIILRTYPLVRGRHFTDSSLKVEIPFNFRVTPKGRENDSPLIISDKFYYSYLLMRYGICLWLTYSSMPYDKGVSALEEIENSDVKRHVIFRKDYERIGKVLAKQAQIFFKKELAEDKRRVIKGKDANFWI